MMRVAVAAGAGLAMTAVAAGPAVALAPPLMCDMGDAAGTAFELGGYNWWEAGDGFVTYDAFEAATGAYAYILEHCPERRQLVLRTETGASDAARDAAAVAMLDEMVRGPAPYTMSEMADRLRDLGMPVEIRNVDYQSCACAGM